MRLDIPAPLSSIPEAGEGDFLSSTQVGDSAYEIRFDLGGGSPPSPIGRPRACKRTKGLSFITGLYQDEDRGMKEIQRVGGLTFSL